MTSIELLAPARDLETARQAILHGADAVYIGADRFGARAGASNSVEDIRILCQEARLFRVKVYVTLNTILRDDELETTQRMAWQLYEAGVDALIVQDMALLQMNLPPIALHASTQMDNRTPEKVAWLRDLGFEQVVLARELGLDDMAEIHRRVPQVSLEVFVHGSICVCYNGQCYASQHLFGRSANRGECAQFCRMPFDLVDADGRVIEEQRYLLSMRDMNRSAHLEQMMDAGVRSFKIEGRLKDIPYVKNVVAYYRQALDSIFERRPEYGRSSSGRSVFGFRPRPEAAFNRGYTDYFLHGRTSDLCNPITPKSMGERVGVVKDLRRDCVIVAGSAAFQNGDGLCFLNDDRRLEGFRVNKAEGNHLYVRQLPRSLRRGMPLWRNQSMQFDAEMARPTAVRKLSLSWVLDETPDGFMLTARVEDGRTASRSFTYDKEPARTPQTDNIERQLSRLGDTVFQADGVEIRLTDNWFLPSSVLSGWRKAVVEELLQSRSSLERKTAPLRQISQTTDFLLPRVLTYRGNVANRLARRFYERHGVEHVEPALEVEPRETSSDLQLMTCRYCILSQLGHCLRKNPPRWSMPLSLRLADGRRFRLQFDCKNCRMNVYAK
ncbi:MAG: U32 family peptidase [Bacteroidaceae bacterium]|nr:U32 family peptidase [Bacteroidaceae bacterium]